MRLLIAELTKERITKWFVLVRFVHHAEVVTEEEKSIKKLGKNLEKKNINQKCSFSSEEEQSAHNRKVGVS